MSRRMQTSFYVVFTTGLVAIIIWVFGQSLSGDWLSISTNFSSAFPYLMGAALGIVWLIRGKR